MAFPYVILPERRLARISLEGRVRGFEIGETIARVYQDRDWQPGFDTFWDGSGITELLLERGEQQAFKLLNEDFSKLAGPGRDILLVVRPIDLQMAQMYAVIMRGGPRQVLVCRTEQEAARILDAPR